MSFTHHRGVVIYKGVFGWWSLVFEKTENLNVGGIPISQKNYQIWINYNHLFAWD